MERGIRKKGERRRLLLPLLGGIDVYHLLQASTTKIDPGMPSPFGISLLNKPYRFTKAVTTVTGLLMSKMKRLHVTEVQLPLM